MQQGLEAVSGDFNGLKELLTREDAAKMLLQKYCNTVVREATSLSEKDLIELN